MTALFSGPG